LKSSTLLIGRMKRSATSDDDQIADLRRPGQCHKTGEQTAERRAQDAVRTDPQLIEKKFELANEEGLRCPSSEVDPLSESMSGKIGSYNKVIPSKRVDIAVKHIR
jgi:hypothetical protein